jgi:hypothetical protein
MFWSFIASDKRRGFVLPEPLHLLRSDSIDLFVRQFPLAVPSIGTEASAFGDTEIEVGQIGGKPTKGLGAC